MIPLLSLTFLFGITTFVADELLEETLGLEAAPVEVISIIFIWEMKIYSTLFDQLNVKELHNTRT